MIPKRASLPGYEIHNCTDIYGVDIRSWTLNNNYHRIGGPAILYGDGSEMWYLGGVHYLESEYWRVLWSSDYMAAADTWLSTYNYWE